MQFKDYWSNNFISMFWIFIHWLRIQLNGQCVAAFASSITFALSAFQVEAEASRAGLLVAIHQGWSVVDLESDCVALISTLASSSDDCSEIGRVVKDCKEYFSEFSSIIFQHVYREVNSVAHKSAHLANFFFWWLLVKRATFYYWRFVRWRYYSEYLKWRFFVPLVMFFSNH